MQFAAHLRSWSPEALRHLLTARPDLLPAADLGFETLARRASSIPSIGRCLIGVDLAMIVVAEALVVSPPATAAEIDELLGANDPVAVLDALERLAAVGLVVVEDTVATPLPGLIDLLDRPLGLGPSFIEEAELIAPELLDELARTLEVAGAPTTGATARAVARRLRTAEGVSRLLDGAPPATAEVLDALTAERSAAVDLPIGHRYRALDDGDPVAWLLRRGLLVPYDHELAEPVRELLVGRHADGLAPTAMLRPIEVLSVTGLPLDAVTAAAADRASRTLEAVETLLNLIDDGGIAVRKTGGIGVRELKRLGKVLELEPLDVGRLLELLDEAVLLNEIGGALVTTDRADVWRRLGRDRRWLTLVRAWLAGERFLSVPLSTPEGGKQLAALDGLQPVADAFGSRQEVLRRAATVADGDALDPEQFTEAVVWHRPNVWGTGDPEPEILVGWTVGEAELLGLVAHAAPTPILRALAAGDDATVESLAAGALGADQDQFLLQSDLTAMALGPLDPAVAAPLGELADRRPDAATPVFAFTEASIRRGFDRGWTAETIAVFLERHALSGVPQPLDYLIGDVARRYGSIRVHGASAVIVTADEALAVEVASTRRAARLGLRLVAPTVLVGPVAPHQLLDELRAEGFFPVLDGEVARLDGSGPGPGPHGADAAGDRTDAALDLPPDWTGPVLSTAALAGEVADVVDALRDDLAHDEQAAAAAPTAADGANGDQHRLHLLWNRPAVITHLCDGELRQAHGVLVAVGDSLTLLNDAGLESLPLDAVVAVDDPSR
ncbi:MAG: helicase-associated domain-containing protein [Actinomycetota bacterium]